MCVCACVELWIAEQHMFTMKMDSSLSKSSSVNTSGASSNRSSGVGTATAPSSLGFREAAHFANIMVEFEDREALARRSVIAQSKQML